VNKPGNVFRGIPSVSFEERIEQIGGGRGVRIERIFTRGQASPQGFWYDQDTDEWVMVIQGRARLQVQDQDELIELAAGDYVSLPAHCRHRVAWTDPDQTTIWLAVHFVAE